MNEDLYEVDPRQPMRVPYERDYVPLACEFEKCSDIQKEWAVCHLCHCIDTVFEKNDGDISRGKNDQPVGIGEGAIRP